MFTSNKDLSKKLAVILFILILLLSESIIYCQATEKYGYHIDELLSFGHSNSSNGGFLFPVKFSGLVIDENDTLYNNWIEPEVFWNYLTVQQDEAFKYSEIKNNLSDSVHPPLYYFLLHTVSSFFTNTFSKWLGIVPNMVIFSLILIILYKISLLLLDSRWKSLLVCAVFGLSIEAVNATIFIRSYLLLTLITQLFVLKIIQLLLDNKPKIHRLIAVFLLATLGTLTHYYFYIFLVVFSIFTGIYLIMVKQTKLFYYLMGAVSFTILFSFLISPNALRHLFLSTRGLESGLRAVVGLTVLGCIASICLLIYRIIRKKNKTQEMPTIRDAFAKIKDDLETKLSQSSNSELIFILLFLTVLIITIVIKLVAPGMDVHSDRYYFYLIPLFCLIAIKLVFSFINRYHLGRKATIIISSIILLLSISSNLFLQSAYLFPPSENRALLNSEIQDSICLFITDSDGIIHNFVDVFFTTERVFAAHEISDISIKTAFSELDQVQKLTVIIDNDIPQTQEELTTLETQVGYPLQFLYEARHGHFLYRVYSLASN